MIIEPDRRKTRRELLKLSPLLVTQTTRHVCVEGRDANGQFGGARLSDFLDHIGADPQARFIVVRCADNDDESLDMATARQPHSLLCYEMSDRPIDRGHGAPLRLQLPTKLGYKQRSTS